jgi:hypothetical protein
MPKNAYWTGRGMVGDKFGDIDPKRAVMVVVMD